LTSPAREQLWTAEFRSSEERQLQLGGLLAVVTTSTTTIWPTPILETEATTNCVMNNWEGYGACMSACVRGGPRVNEHYPWTQNDTILENITKLIGSEAEWERRKAAGTEKGTQAWLFFNRVGLAMKECDFLFTRCDAQCADCVDCRREEDRDLCNAHLDEFQENEEFECLVGYTGCGAVCPRRYLYPRCITCCKCQDWDIMQGRLRQKAKEDIFVYTPADTVDAEDVYSQKATPSPPPPILGGCSNAACNFVRQAVGWWTYAPIIEFGVAIAIIAVVLVVLKKGGLHDALNKTEQIQLKSTRTGKIYRGQSDYVKDDLGPARSFKQDEDAPLGKMPRIVKPPTPRVETPRQIVQTNWEDMVRADKAAAQAGIPALPEETNKDIPMCLLFLEGTCRRGPSCHYRHDSENPFPQTIGVLALPGTVEPSLPSTRSSRSQKKPGRSVQPRKW
jgi:hypothetical protein